MSQECEPHNGFEKNVTFYLDAAGAAMVSGQPRLAIHLFRAAFEIESQNGDITSPPVIDGLRKAWDLACAEGDRSIAESVLGDLSAFNSDEENRQATLRLQALALDQLEDMGITEHDIENMVGSIASGLAESNGLSDILESLKSAVEHLGMAGEHLGLASELMPDGMPILPEGFDLGLPGHNLALPPEALGLPGQTAADIGGDDSGDDSGGATAGTHGAHSAQSEAGVADNATDIQDIKALDDSKESQGSQAIQKAEANNKPSQPQRRALPPIRDTRPSKPPARQEPSASMQAGLSKLNSQLRQLRERNRDGSNESRLNYQTLIGFDAALEKMRGYGFISAGDAAYRNFIERSAAMHGVSSHSLEGCLLFYGPSQDDVSLFAHATAGEIGFPILHITVELDKQGNGTIKLAGPFRRGLFGAPPDIMDMATPCIVLIEGIDLLLEMFANEQTAIRRHGARVRGMVGQPGRSMQAEITSYLKALRQKPDVVVMATAKHADGLKEPLRSLFAPIHEIEVKQPCVKERLDVLSGFAAEHPSFAELDLMHIAHLSDGLSRSELVHAGHAAVESAYRSGLRQGSYSRVTFADVAMNMASYIDHASPFYRQMEDEAVAQMYLELEQGID